jgi:hypothetical protein
MTRTFAPLLVALLFAAGCATAPKPQTADWPRYRLTAEQTTLLELPGGKQFDASGLLILPSGEMLTLANNLGPQLYRIDLMPGENEARLVPTDSFEPEQIISEFAVKPRELDCEGITQDAKGRLYVCEEKNRWILRCDARAGRVERLPIDWSPVQRFFNGLDPNASFEGIAIGHGKLYVANERTSPVIIVVDLETLQTPYPYTPDGNRGPIPKP